MSKKIIAFAASSSKQSVNKQLASWAAQQTEGTEVEVLDLNDFEMPIYSIDKEQESGIHPLAQEFKSKIDSSDGIVISFAEHNGSFSAAYKNVYDWVSRIDMAVWQNKPMYLLATSPGPRGGAGVLIQAKNLYSYSNKNTIVDFSLPSFHNNFNTESGISEEDLLAAFNEKLSEFQKAL